MTQSFSKFGAHRIEGVQMPHRAQASIAKFELFSVTSSVSLCLCGYLFERE